MEIHGQKVYSAWKSSIRKVINSNSVVPTERNGDTIEINNAIIIVSNPLKDLEDIIEFDKNRGNDYERRERKKYWSSINKRLEEFPSKSNNFNQIDNIVLKLKNSDYNRQSYATIWVPEYDLKSKYPVCIVGIHFCIRDGKLNMTAILRSNDAWGQALDDMYHLIKIQEIVAKKLSKPIGQYTHIAMSYHIYLTDLFKAKKFIEDGYYA